MRHTLAALVIAGTVPALAHHNPPQTICVHVDNVAQVSPDTLRWAMSEASRVFRTAEIELDWQAAGADSPEDRGTDMSAEPRMTDTRKYLLVRLLRNTPATVIPGTLGYALPFAQKGAHAVVFWDRIDLLAKTANAASYTILGYAMAHELGHVLLRSTDHSAAGLMQAQWDRAAYRLASAGLISFLPEQVNRMRYLADAHNLQAAGGR